MNLGQLARTKGLGALKLVDQMEREFSRARELDEQLDYAGPDRNLGLLYRDAPAIGSVGSRTRAREHLKRAVELAPQYPENRLNLIEAYLKWGERTGAYRELAGARSSLARRAHQLRRRGLGRQLGRLGTAAQEAQEEDRGRPRNRWAPRARTDR